MLVDNKQKSGWILRIFGFSVFVLGGVSSRSLFCFGDDAGAALLRLQPICSILVSTESRLAGCSAIRCWNTIAIGFAFDGNVIAPLKAV